MAEIDYLENTIDSILKAGKGSGVLIKGGWGTGKSHFWRRVSENIDGTNITMSLFRMSSVSEIKREILLSLYSRNKHISKIKDVFKGLKSTLRISDKIDEEASAGFNIGGIPIPLDALLSLGEKEDFEGVNICFDDFERIPDDLKIKEVLGYISFLKEEKNCNVIIIMDAKKLDKLENGDDGANEKDKKDRQVWNEYKEKVIDYEFEFSQCKKTAFESIYNAVFEEAGLSSEIKKKLMDVYIESSTNNLRSVKRGLLNVYRIKDDVETEVELWHRIVVSVFLMTLDCQGGNENIKQAELLLPYEIITKLSSYVKSGFKPDGLNGEVIDKYKDYGNEKTVRCIVDEYAHKLNIDMESFLREIEELFFDKKTDPEDMWSCMFFLKRFDKNYDKDRYIDILKEKLRVNIGEFFATNSDTGRLLSITRHKFQGDSEFYILFEEIYKEIENELAAGSGIGDAEICGIIENMYQDASWGEKEEVILKNIKGKRWKRMIEEKLLNLGKLTWVCNNTRILGGKDCELIIALNELTDGSPFGKYLIEWTGIGKDN